MTGSRLTASSRRSWQSCGSCLPMQSDTLHVTSNILHSSTTRPNCSQPTACSLQHISLLAGTGSLYIATTISQAPANSRPYNLSIVARTHQRARHALWQCTAFPSMCECFDRGGAGAHEKEHLLHNSMPAITTNTDITCFTTRKFYIYTCMC